MTVQQDITVTCDDWTNFPPGPGLARALADARFAELSDAELIAVMAAARRQTSWTQALELTAVAELSRRRHDEESGLASRGMGNIQINEIVTEEVSLALTLTGTSAAGWVCLAEQLAEDLPATGKALVSGRIDLRRAQVIADALRGLPRALAAAVDATIADEASSLTTGQLRHRIRCAVKAADPDAFEGRRRAALRDRSLQLFDNATGTSDLALRNMTAEDAHAIYNRINAAAQALKADGDDRPIDHLRADLTQRLLRGLELPEAIRVLLMDGIDGMDDRGDRGAPAEHDREPARTDGDTTDPVAAVDRQIAEALAELTDEHLTALLAQARMNGRLDGLALLTAQAAQAMADGLEEVANTWCRTSGRDPGRHGHDGYRPPAAMRRLIEHRHPTCVFPTCNARSARCDLDHTRPHGRGGATCRCNLAPLCRRHHRLKQHSRWRLLQPWPGLLIWITPSGTWHIVTPVPRE
ncbi:HNH endonuclease signature motif containing protein [Actinomadura sp. HBU206391]|uniref:HNH endonuclease signature motif containing protein n=1 Tax=Actinomadura sp. HBU206391 TaxID=2731692 RepID=UPI00164F4A91|nr:HNH endonuclease signature motif containing protein [Actinomadura sp. HBU206391]MBC6462603.1 DUF222 domain-containing protein [Actinomadura sp. HBU206391]